MADFKTSLTQYQNLINDRLDKIFAEREPKINDAMRYSVMAGGKRIRPVLALASCEACGTDPEKAILFACALEIIHTYSLIYDDLPCMDNDVLRRGKPTNHVVYGQDVALLAGMGLYARAFEIIHDGYRSLGLSADQVLTAEEVLLSASGMNGIVLGQYFDIENVAANSVVDERYIHRVHELKTSAMLEASVLVGAIAANATEEQKNALHTYAKAIGLAFQIRDDVLDVIGDEKNMGKSLGKDSHDKKMTFVDLYGLEKAQEEVVRLSAEGKRALEPFGEKKQFLCDLADMLCSRIH